ncbi:MAG TPA: O-methyltransferase [Clostridia bacterium]|nr:O-methyltransferase [Clostridia bacterium]
MNGITDPDVEHYMYSMLPARDAVLQEMEQKAEQRNIPIVGPAVGRLLYQLAKMVGAKTVFELGSAIGYSTIWWARAVGDDGLITYTDGARKNADEARGYLDRAGVKDRVRVLVGDALELLSEEKGEFDIIFCDVDKEDYPRALRLAVPKVRKGGLLVADNSLWHGRVAQATGASKAAGELESSTKAILEFNRALYQMQDFWTTIVPLRDGVSVALKL